MTDRPRFEARTVRCDECAGKLDHDQATRAEAARVAREVLAPRGIAGAGAVDVTDVTMLAEWLVYGPELERLAELPPQAPQRIVTGVPRGE